MSRSAHKAFNQIPHIFRHNCTDKIISIIAEERANSSSLWPSMAAIPTTSSKTPTMTVCTVATENGLALVLCAHHRPMWMVSNCLACLSYAKRHSIAELNLLWRRAYIARRDQMAIGHIGITQKDVIFK